MNTNNVKLIRLITGEEIVAEVVPTKSPNSNVLAIKNPIRVVMIPSANQSQPKIGFAPWVEFSKDDTFEIGCNFVLFQSTPIPQFLDQYKSTFSSLILPTTNGILSS